MNNTILYAQFPSTYCIARQGRNTVHNLVQQRINLIHARAYHRSERSHTYACPQQACKVLHRTTALCNLARGVTAATFAHTQTTESRIRPEESCLLPNKDFLGFQSLISV
jgi:hypothetical protein